MPALHICYLTLILRCYPQSLLLAGTHCRWFFGCTRWWMMTPMSWVTRKCWFLFDTSPPQCLSRAQGAIHHCSHNSPWHTSQLEGVGGLSQGWCPEVESQTLVGVGREGEQGRGGTRSILWFHWKDTACHRELPLICTSSTVRLRPASNDDKQHLQDHIMRGQGCFTGAASLN